MNIGLFGGTFNPIHRCHLQVADQVRQTMGLDRVLFIPAGSPPLKDHALAPAADRMIMTRLATEPYAWADVSSIEVDRPGPSYSVDTVTALRHEHPDDQLFFLVGADAFADILSWREPERLLTLCEFIVMSRPDHSFESLRLLPLFTYEEPARLRALDRGELSQERVTLSSGARIWLVHVPSCPVSATQVRAAVHKGAPLDALLPEGVRSYILRQRLYR